MWASNARPYNGGAPMEHRRAGPWSRRKRPPPLTRGLSPPYGSDWGVNSLRLRLAAKPPPSKRGRQGGRSMTAPTRAAHRIPSPGGEGGTAPAVTDEECGRKPNKKQTVPGFIPRPTSRRSSPVFFDPPSSARKIHPPPGGGYRRPSNARPYEGNAPMETL